MRDSRASFVLLSCMLELESSSAIFSLENPSFLCLALCPLVLSFALFIFPPSSLSRHFEPLIPSSPSISIFCFSILLSPSHFDCLSLASIFPRLSHSCCPAILVSSSCSPNCFSFSSLLPFFLCGHLKFSKFSSFSIFSLAVSFLGTLSISK